MSSAARSDQRGPPPPPPPPSSLAAEEGNFSLNSNCPSISLLLSLFLLGTCCCFPLLDRQTTSGSVFSPLLGPPRLLIFPCDACATAHRQPDYHLALLLASSCSGGVRFVCFPSHFRWTSPPTHYYFCVVKAAFRRWLHSSEAATSPQLFSLRKGAWSAAKEAFVRGHRHGRLGLGWGS